MAGISCESSAKSYEMSSLTFFRKKLKKNYFRMLSAAVVIDFHYENIL